MLANEKLNLVKSLVKELSRDEIIWTNGYLAGLVANQTQDEPKEQRVLTSIKPTIIYGTETGNVKKLANQLLGIFKKNSSEIKRFILVEKRPSINWKITKESQKILGYTCYKATTKFRGRDYIAWFSPDIPYNLGPWKLGGLPGLILKVENDLFDYDAIRIVLNSDKIPTIPKLKNFENAKRKYTMTRTIEFENNWLTYLKNNFIASLPTGNRVQESPLRKDVREFLIDE